MSERFVPPLRQLRSNIGRRVRNFRRNRAEGVGHDFITDIKNRLPHVPIQTVFDVGAHIGMTALEFGDAFPNADIWAFEPHPANLERLRANLIGKPDTRIFDLGFSDKPGELRFHYDPKHPSMARIADDGETAIDVETLDRFCGAKVPHISLLKIDVEGHELQVLKGAERMLAESRISIIRAETAIDPDIPYHTQLFDLCDYIHPFGYRLFGFYDQWEFPLGNTPKLRRFDAAWISDEVSKSRGQGT